jgi:uncharacterized protein (DUF3084 family)
LSPDHGIHQQGRAKAEELEVEVDKKDAQLQGLENEADRDMRRAADTERMSKEAEDAAGVATDKGEIQGRGVIGVYQVTNFASLGTCRVRL